MTPETQKALLAEADERCALANRAVQASETARLYAEAEFYKAQTKVVALQTQIIEEQLQALINAHLKSDDPDIRQHGVKMAEHKARRLCERSTEFVQRASVSEVDKPSDSAALEVFSTVNAAGYARMKDEMERTASQAEAEAARTTDESLRAQLIDAAVQARALASDYALALQAELEVVADGGARTGFPAGRV